MKPIATAADQLAFRLALEAAQARLGGPESAGEAPGGPGGGQRPQEAPGRAVEGRRGLPEGVRSLGAARAAQRAQDAADLEVLAWKAGMAPEAARSLANGLRAPAGTNDWMFVMLSPSQNSAVVRWLSENSSRPIAALRLWARLFEVMRNDTGEVLQSREELALWLGTNPRNLSTIMGELASINAVRREKRGREVRYFMNSNVATHLPGPALRQAAREADGPLLVAMRGGLDQDDQAGG